MRTLSSFRRNMITQKTAVAKNQWEAQANLPKPLTIMKHTANRQDPNRVGSLRRVRSCFFQVAALQAQVYAMDMMTETAKSSLIEENAALTEQLELSEALIG